MLTSNWAIGQTVEIGSTPSASPRPLGALHGYTGNDIIHQGRLDPGAELIGKPFTYATLVAKIQRLLRRAA